MVKFDRFELALFYNSGISFVFGPSSLVVTGSVAVLVAAAPAGSGPDGAADGNRSNPACAECAPKRAALAAAVQVRA
jgi:hypothetical protein